MVGAIVTLIDVSLIFVLVEYAKFPVITTAVISYLPAILTSFALNSRFTFKTKQINSATALPKFIAISLSGYVLNIFILYVLHRLVGIYYITAKIAATGIVFLGRFFANRSIVFRKDVVH